MAGDATRTRTDSVASLPEAAPALPLLRIRDLGKIYRGKKGAIRALNNATLDIYPGEFISLLGPSGSGKTTLLMLIAGFESPSSGSIEMQGEDISRKPPEARNLGMVFQGYALFPHMSVSANVAYPLKIRHVNKAERAERTNKILSTVGLHGLGDRRPSQLSGGQQQRVALARALVYQPSLLLLDEPLGALDRWLRERMQDELRQLHDQLKVTFLYVTHDQDEAMSMSDRIVLINEGAVSQVSSPSQLYQRPETPFAARFVGRSNLLGCRITTRDGEIATADLLTEKGRAIATFKSPVSDRVEPGQPALVLVRPEHVELARQRSSAVTSQGTSRDSRLVLDGILQHESFTGNLWHYVVMTNLGRILTSSTARELTTVGEQVTVSWRSEDSWIIASDSQS